LSFPLLQADAECIPLTAGCAGLVISEFGASVWCDPYRWLPEAARLMGQSGLAVEDLIEVQVPPGFGTDFAGYPGAWTDRWPAEEVWFARWV
jgi:hypothetical protein